MNLQTSTLIIAIILCAILAILIVCWLVLYLCERFREIRYFKIELKRAHNEEEIARWKRRLRIAYICLIPGITPSLFKKKKKKNKNSR